MSSRSARERSLLRWVLGSFFLALALPTAVLIRQATTQLRWESFHQLRMQAADLALRIDGRIDQLIEDEENRPVGDYSFLVASGEPQAHFIQRSILSNHLGRPAIPGLIGYFQIDSSGQFSTPLLPSAGTETSLYGIVGADLKRRVEIQTDLQRLLVQNRLLPAPGDSGIQHATTQTRTGAGQNTGPSGGHPRAEYMATREPFQAIDALFNPRFGQGVVVGNPVGALGRIEQLTLNSNFEKLTRNSDGTSRAGTNTRPTPRQGASRREKVVVLSTQTTRISTFAGLPGQISNAFQIAMFDAEVQPFRLAQLASGHLLLVRNVYRNRLRQVQGMVVDPVRFVDSLIGSAFIRTPLAEFTRLTVAHRGNILAEFRSRHDQQGTRGLEAQPRELLYRGLLSPEPKSLELIFAIERLPPGPGQELVAWSGTILTVLMCGGFLLIYRLGLRRIRLSQQQQDFVAAVTHELKTPLTSIRMHGEMLRENWVPEGKRASCYEFICSESERLSRLIGNVLDLARMNREPQRVALIPTDVGTVSADLRGKVLTQFASSGFAFAWDCPDELGAVPLAVDEDALTQIVINLVDNAVKFAAKAAERRIDIRWERPNSGTVSFGVRDYGPGVPAQMTQKIFRLFVRGENELTRSTVGAGIGLALVKKYAQAMNARVDVVNRSPGAEFRVHFPV